MTRTDMTASLTSLEWKVQIWKLHNGETVQSFTAPSREAAEALMAKMTPSLAPGYFGIRIIEPDAGGDRSIPL